MTSKFLLHRARNEALRCNARGCFMHRVRLFSTCKAHRARAIAYGHPDAGPIKRRELVPYRKEVEALLSANDDHPGLHEVLSWLRSWMAQASADPRAFKGAAEVARLVSAGVTPKALLVEFLAGMLWLSEHGQRLPDDRSRDFFLSRVVFALAPRPRKATHAPGWWQKPDPDRIKTPHSYAIPARTSALVYVGKHLRETLAVFIATVQHGIESMRALKVDPFAHQKAPMRAPAPAHRGSPGQSGLPFP